LRFEESELDFSQPMQRVPTADSGRPENRQRRSVPMPGRRLPWR
jgi:hypothetical protein